MPCPSNPVSLSKEAYERLCAIRDYLYDTLGTFYSLNEVCSVIICQVDLRGIE